MVHVFEVPPVVTCEDTASYFWGGGPNVTWQTPVRDSGWTGGLFWAWSLLLLFSCVVVSLPSGKCPGVPQVVLIPPVEKYWWSNAVVLKWEVARRWNLPSWNLALCAIIPDSKLVAPSIFPMGLRLISLLAQSSPPTASASGGSRSQASGPEDESWLIFCLPPLLENPVGASLTCPPVSTFLGGVRLQS